MDMVRIFVLLEVKMALRNGLLPGEFVVRLPHDTELILNGHKLGAAHRLLVDTPTAAEIIKAIAGSSAFEAHRNERRALKRLASRIAGRYSGH